MLYLLIAPYDNEKVDLLNIVEAMYPRELEQEDTISKYVRKLLTFELMPMNEEQVERSLHNFEPFLESTKNHKRHISEFVKQLI